VNNYKEFYNTTIIYSYYYIIFTINYKGLWKLFYTECDPGITNSKLIFTNHRPKLLFCLRQFSGDF